MPSLPSIESLIIVAAVAIIAITFHEAAHGYVAWKLGDDTAHQQGRVSFNPIRHIDPFGTVVLPLLLYISTGLILGYAKPVPVNPSRLHSPRRDMILVAAAGPTTNFLLAFLSAVLLAIYGPLGQDGDFIRRLLNVSITFNVLIAVFNLIPIPPFDGGRIAVGLLPGRLAFSLQRLESFGMGIVIVLLIAPLIAYQLFGIDFDPLGSVISRLVSYIRGGMVDIVGLGDPT